MSESEYGSETESSTESVSLAQKQSIPTPSSLTPISPLSLPSSPYNMSQPNYVSIIKEFGVVGSNVDGSNSRRSNRKS